MPGDDKQFSVAMKVQAGNRLKHCLKNTSSTQRDDGAGKVPLATDTDKTYEQNAANNDGKR